MIKTSWLRIQLQTLAITELWGYQNDFYAKRLDNGLITQRILGKYTLPSANAETSEERTEELLQHNRNPQRIITAPLTGHYPFRTNTLEPEVRRKMTNIHQKT